MNQIEIFNSPEFGSIRTLEQNGKVLFCGTDVATALGYTNPRKAVRDHTRGGTKCSIGVQTGKKADGSPAVQMVEMLFIPEKQSAPALYGGHPIVRDGDCRKRRYAGGCRTKRSGDTGNPCRYFGKAGICRFSGTKKEQERRPLWLPKNSRLSGKPLGTGSGETRSAARLWCASITKK